MLIAPTCPPPVNAPEPKPNDGLVKGDYYLFYSDINDGEEEVRSRGLEKRDNILNLNNYNINEFTKSKPSLFGPIRYSPLSSSSNRLNRKA